MGTGTVVGVILVALAIIWVGSICYNNWQTGLAYQRDIGGFYEYADRASDAKIKAEDFNKYINALQVNGLTNGSNSVFYTNQPTSILENDFQTAKSLQTRLNVLANMDENNPGYQFGISQINQEFCWYPDTSFEHAYFIKHGQWGVALWPVQQENKCDSSNKS